MRVAFKKIFGRRARLAWGAAAAGAIALVAVGTAAGVFTCVDPAGAVPPERCSAGQSGTGSFEGLIEAGATAHVGKMKPSGPRAGDVSWSWCKIR